MRISYTIAGSTLGPVLVGVTDAGVCAVMLADSEGELTDALRAEFPRAILTRDDRAAGQTGAVTAYIDGSSASRSPAPTPRM
jgi:AraC family transcriptional regulator of adaptative response/methylated-DNA-[protein]-cysteine methyltransferase